MKIALIILQVIVLLLAAPLISGFITVIKNNLRMRKGASIFQPYYNMAKLFTKDEVISVNASWIYRVAPYILFASTAVTAALAPLFAPSGYMNYAGDFFVIIFVLALGRFFMSLAALDTASSFGGMGSSREMFISSLVEPVACVVIFSLALASGSTGLSILGGAHVLKMSSLIAAVAFFMVIIAETSRLPVDNQETHLELTMIHEAMILEYSGRPLALIELSVHLKQLVLFALMSNVVLASPALDVGAGTQVIVSGLLIAAKITGIAAAIALMEIAGAKMRLFRAVDFLGFAFILAMMSLIAVVLRV